MKPHKLSEAYREVGRTDLLTRLVKTSKDAFGFFTDRYTRVFEYTWLLERMEGRKGKALEIGAGVSPLPIILAEDGWKVTTVDMMPDTNIEWGFREYSHPNITSKLADFAEYKDRKRYDVIYSISAVEHMPKATRVKVFENAYKLLKKDGLLYLTIDLDKYTENLWNKNMGKRIEDGHGDTIDIEIELEDIGFKIISFTIQTGIKGVACDLLYIVAEK